MAVGVLGALSPMIQAGRVQLGWLRCDGRYPVMVNSVGVVRDDQRAQGSLNRGMVIMLMCIMLRVRITVFSAAKLRSVMRVVIAMGGVPLNKALWQALKPTRQPNML